MLMRGRVLPLAAAVLLCCRFFAAAQEQETEERIDTGRFGAEEPLTEDSGSTGKTYKNHWLFLGARLGPSLRLYTPQGDTPLTGGDTPGFSLDLGLQASVQILSVFSIQAEMVFTWDNAPVWNYIYLPEKDDVDRYTREFSSFSLQIPLMAKLNFYPGVFRVSPFFGAYVLVPLGGMKMSSSRDKEQNYSYSFSPPVGLLGGINAAYPMGPGMIFADLRYAGDLGEPNLQDSGGPRSYQRNMFSLSIGYEFGFFAKTGSAK
jgi:hypothetical protein